MKTVKLNIKHRDVTYRKLQDMTYAELKNKTYRELQEEFYEAPEPIEKTIKLTDVKESEIKLIEPIKEVRL